VSIASAALKHIARFREMSVVTAKLNFVYLLQEAMLPLNFN
jgi:hypothetical protein